jgi:V/A-type H+-transporting ATPase subunit G/H
MTRAEILTEIKQAEEEAKKLVAQANEARIQKINETKAKSRENLKRSEYEAQQYAESKMSRAREIINQEKGEIIEKGALEAENTKKKAKKNITKATKFILTEFERAVNA